MKSNQEIADLIFRDPDSYEAIVRAIHLPLPEFLHWVRNTPLAIEETYWVMGSLGIPIVGTTAFHSKFQKDKQEILKHFNNKFNVANREN